MARDCDKTAGPVVSVLMATFNRPRYLPLALASILRQSYRRLQVIVVNDGGVDVSGIVDSFHDPRVILINRRQNMGKPHSLNEALARAEGKYVAYLDDDDLYYPHHIETLVNTLEGPTDCQVAYSDFYRTLCRVCSNGDRRVLSKVVDVRRDFDRFFMLHFNHVLHVTLMHRRDLIDKTGLYNEELNVLIDWDMTRRLVFFSDFLHVCEVTGEYYQPVGDCDRISVQRRKDKSQYARNVMTIRTTRPPKPWAKIQDMSIILADDRLDRQTGKTIGDIWQHTFYPYKLYLPLPECDIDRLNADMPHLVKVPVHPAYPTAQRVDAALAQCEGRYVGLVPSGFPIKDMWIENALYALMNSPADRLGFEMDDSTDLLWGTVVNKSDLLAARAGFPELAVRKSLAAAGVTLRAPSFEELPFQFDNLLAAAREEQQEGNYREAAHIFEHIGEHYHNKLLVSELAAKALFRAGDHIRAAEISRSVNQTRPTVDTLLLEAKVRREQKDFASAIALLTKAERLLSDPDLDVPDPLPACRHDALSAGSTQSENLRGNDFTWT